MMLAADRSCVKGAVRSSLGYVVARVAQWLDCVGTVAACLVSTLLPVAAQMG